jgi:hypothetical protein
MKSTWKKADSPRRRNLCIGCALFVTGICIAAYCGYMDRYIDEPQSAVLVLAGWGSLFAGLTLFLLGILQGPIRR